MRTKIPMKTSCDDTIDREQVINAKAKMVSRDTCAKQQRFKFGDKVVVMQKKKNKLTTVFNPTPLTIKNVKGSTITASKNDWSISRNASTFRKLYGSILKSSKNDGEEMHEDHYDTNEQSDRDKKDEDKDNDGVDSEQDNEGANDVDAEPRMARLERDRQPPAWQRDYKTQV